MRLGDGQGVGVPIAALCVLAACGQSSSGRASPSENCQPPSDVPERADTLPARLSGTLCTESDELALSVPRDGDDAARSVVHLNLAQGAGTYSVNVLAYVEGTLVPVPNSTESSTFELSASVRDGFFTPYFLASDDDRMVLSLSGTPGSVALDVDRPALGPTLPCSGEYEGLPVETPPLTLPASFELELCNGRDSRVWSVTVAAGRPVVVTLENPASMDSFSLNVYRDGTDYESLPVTDGDTRATLGLATGRTLSFVPAESGTAAFYASGGISRGEKARLRIEQP